MTDQQEDKTFEVTTTAQVERVYAVLAQDEEQAHTRLRAHLKDSGSLREGLVVEQGDRQIDATPQRVKTDGIVEVAKGPRAVEAAAS